MFLGPRKTLGKPKLPKPTTAKINRLANAMIAAARLSANRKKAPSPMKNNFFTGTVKPRNPKVRLTAAQKAMMSIVALGTIGKSALKNLTGLGIPKKVKKQRAYTARLKKLTNKNQQAARNARARANLARLTV
jgi:hypothetical protein